MPIPQISPEEIARDSDGGLNFGVLTAMTHAKATMGNTVLAFFADRVPERGEKLWNRFREGQKRRPEAGFTDFIVGVVRQDMVKLLLPKICTLPDTVQVLLVERSQQALMKAGARTDEDMASVYFGEGRFYEAVRAAVCKGCHQTKCPIWRRT